MKEPDYDFWRKERHRVLNLPEADYHASVEVGNYLAAIDVILETETTRMGWENRKEATQ